MISVPDVSVIIVNYNTAALVVQAIDSILAQQGITTEILVVDNASIDDSQRALSAYEGRAQILLSPENLGFGRANNLAAQSARGRHLFLFNPDARLRAKDGLCTLVRHLDESPELGILGPIFHDPQGVAQDPPRLQYPGQRHVRADFASLPGKIAWMIGAALLIRRDVYVRVQGFDPDFFLYGEETDLCLRVRRAGYALGQVDGVVVTHVQGASESGNAPFRVWMRKQAGLHLFYTKHYASDEVKRLVRREYVRARYRLLLLRAKGLVAALSSRELGKIDKYRAMQACASETLGRQSGP